MRTCDENIKKSASKSRSKKLNLDAASGLNLAPQAVLKNAQSGSRSTSSSYRIILTTIKRGIHPTCLFMEE